MLQSAAAKGRCQMLTAGKTWPNPCRISQFVLLIAVCPRVNSPVPRAIYCSAKVPQGRLCQRSPPRFARSKRVSVRTSGWNSGAAGFSVSRTILRVRAVFRTWFWSNTRLCLSSSNPLLVRYLTKDLLLPHKATINATPKPYANTSHGNLLLASLGAEKN